TPSTTFFDVFDNASVSYSLSTAPVFIDLRKNPQFGGGGFAFGDTLNNIYEITGSSQGDVIRGLDDLGSSGKTIINNPGDNVFNGGGGDDVLEGRGGADVLNGGSGADH